MTNKLSVDEISSIDFINVTIKFSFKNNSDEGNCDKLFTMIFLEINEKRVTELRNCSNESFLLTVPFLDFLCKIESFKLVVCGEYGIFLELDMLSTEFGRVVCNSEGDFHANIFRKPLRSKNKVIVCLAAMQCLQNEYTTKVKAVSLAALAYRLVENPSLIQEWNKTYVLNHYDLIVRGISVSDPDDVRWLSSLNIMMFNLFVVLDEPDNALIYLNKLYENRNFVNMQPMCAFNVMIGIFTLGYIHFRRGNTDSAAKVWSSWQNVFFSYVNGITKEFGPVYEMQFIYKGALSSLSGVCLINGLKDKRVKIMDQQEAVDYMLRVTTKKARNRGMKFLTKVSAQS